MLPTIRASSSTRAMAGLLNIVDIGPLKESELILPITPFSLPSTVVVSSVTTTTSNSYLSPSLYSEEIGIESEV